MPIISNSETESASHYPCNCTVTKGIAEAEVRAEMEIAMMAGYNNPDPAVQAEWAKAPFENRVPTVEEFLSWCVERVSDNFSEFVL